MELTKSEKRIARELVSKSVDEECRQFMEKVEALVGRRRDDQAPKERFWELHDMFREFARHLKQKYDGIPGSYDLKIMVFGKTNQQGSPNGSLSRLLSQIHKSVIFITQ